MDDDRKALIRHIRKHLPAIARIVQGRRAGRPGPSCAEQYASQGIPPLERKAVFLPKTDDIMDAARLRARGFTQAAANEDVLLLLRAKRRGGAQEAKSLSSEEGRVFRVKLSGRDEFPARLALIELGKEPEEEPRP